MREEGGVQPCRRRVEYSHEVGRGMRHMGMGVEVDRGSPWRGVGARHKGEEEESRGSP